jgi:hypothetical protein
MPRSPHPTRARFLRQGAAAFFGLMLLAGSALLAAASTGLVRLRDTFVAGPDLVLPLAWLGGWAGAALLARGLAEMAFARRRRRLKALRPDEPWLRDHPWDPAGNRERPLADAVRALLALVVVGTGLGGLFAWAWRTDVVAAVVVGLFGLFYLAWALATVFVLWRFVRHGAVRVTWSRFPLHLGERARLRVACARPWSDFGRVTLTLACVRERAEQGTDDDDDESALRHVARERHRQSRTFDGEALASELEAAFDLPGGPLATRLFSAEPLYWELRVDAEGGRGPSLATALLLPVYAREPRRD